MLLVGRCRAVGVTMLGRHATETRAAAHNMALVLVNRDATQTEAAGVKCGRELSLWIHVSPDSLY